MEIIISKHAMYNQNIRANYSKQIKGFLWRQQPYYIDSSKGSQLAMSNS